jgi:steroid 5-alpha reductase family enzyme
MLVINLIMMRQIPVPAGTVATVMEIVIVEIVTAVIVAIMTVGAAIVAVTVGAAIVIDKIETVELGVVPSATFNVMEQQHVFYNKMLPNDSDISEKNIC